MSLSRPLAAALAASALAPAAAAHAAPQTHAFRLDVAITAETSWTSHSANQVCTDRRFVWDGVGRQKAELRARQMLVTLRKGRFAFPAVKERETLPYPGAGTLELFPLAGTVDRFADYELSYQGEGSTCLPGRAVGTPPATDGCGVRRVRGGLFGLVPAKGTVQPVGLSLFTDPYDGTCPAESTAAMMLQETGKIEAGANALRQLTSPRVRRVVVRGSADTRTADAFGTGPEDQQGAQRNELRWTLTFTRVG